MRITLTEIWSIGFNEQHVANHCFCACCYRNKYSCLVQLHLEKRFLGEIFKTGSRVYLKFNAQISKETIFTRFLNFENLRLIIDFRPTTEIRSWVLLSTWQILLLRRSRETQPIPVLLDSKEQPVRLNKRRASGLSIDHLRLGLEKIETNFEIFYQSFRFHWLYNWLCVC